MKRVLALIVLSMAIPLGADAQGKRSGPTVYPNVDEPVRIAEGESVRLLIRYVNDRGPNLVSSGKRLDLVYSTRIPASDAAGRRAQADRAAQVLGAQATELGMNKLSLGICDTEACSQRKHPPSDWYLYERTNSGWKRVP